MTERNNAQMKKIKIDHIDPKLMKQQGLYGDGCYGSDCHSVCCEYGCDVDVATLKMIEKHRDLIEPLIKAKIEDCFSTPLKQDDDYIGGAYRETATRKKDKTCAFRLRDGQKGCSLFFLWVTKKLPKRIIPTICRTYPVTWHRGSLFIDTPLRKECVCKVKPPADTIAPSLFDTQKKEVMALFEISKGAWGAKPAGAKTPNAKAGKTEAAKSASKKTISGRVNMTKESSPKKAAAKKTVKKATVKKAAVKKTVVKKVVAKKTVAKKAVVKKAVVKKVVAKKAVAKKTVAKKAVAKKAPAKKAPVKKTPAKK
ncbi:MAG: histone H1-like repetitive region-containing protein [Deltaproteobacteria bacterium]